MHKIFNEVTEAEKKYKAAIFKNNPIPLEIEKAKTEFEAAKIKLEINAKDFDANLNKVVALPSARQGKQ